jgi:hypothetical protein
MRVVQPGSPLTAPTPATVRDCTLDLPDLPCGPQQPPEGRSVIDDRVLISVDGASAEGLSLACQVRPACHDAHHVLEVHSNTWHRPGCTLVGESGTEQTR